MVFEELFGVFISGLFGAGSCKSAGHPVADHLPSLSLLI